MAFIFGSQSKGQTTIESDFDIAVYFKPKSGILEYEEDVFYEEENEIWNDVEKITKCKVDLIALNSAASTLAFPIIKNGIPIVIKNRLRYLDFMLKVSSTAIDFREFMRDFRLIKARSRSLVPEDKDRLIKLVDFLESELNDYEKYENLNFITYENDREKRRSCERWTENIINASIDIAKVLLASEKKQLPDTYADTLRLLATLRNFNEDTAEKLASFVRLRNIMAHEYLDLRFSRLQDFIKEAKNICSDLVNFTDNFLKKNDVE
jgi:uncharacterized protein YutE (UPF0331/DUF86 family)/predicted nucleotidyltransferase